MWDRADASVEKPVGAPGFILQTELKYRVGLLAELSALHPHQRQRCTETRVLDDDANLGFEHFRVGIGAVICADDLSDTKRKLTAHLGVGKLITGFIDR